MHHPVFRLTTEQVVIDRIKIPKDRDTTDPAVVNWLIDSIPKVGLLTPIICYRPNVGMGIHLVTGRNRLDACRRLGYSTITARVEQSGDPRAALWCELAQIEENFAGFNREVPLSHLERRKELIQLLCPAEAVSEKQKRRA